MSEPKLIFIKKQMMATINELKVPGAIGELHTGHTLTTKSIIVNKIFFNLVS